MNNLNNTSESVELKRYSISLLLPFKYAKNQRAKLLSDDFVSSNERTRMWNLHDYKNSEWWTKAGRELCGLVQNKNSEISVYVLKWDYVNRFGLYHNQNTKYHFKKNKNISFQFGDIKLWILQGETCFIEVNISANDITSNDAVSLMDSVYNRINHRDNVIENDEIELTRVKTITEKIVKYLGGTYDIESVEWKERCHCISFIETMTEQNDNYSAIQLLKPFSNELKLESDQAFFDNHMVKYPVGNNKYYLYWSVSNQTISVLGSSQNKFFENYFYKSLQYNYSLIIVEYIDFKMSMLNGGFLKYANNAEPNKVFEKVKSVWNLASAPPLRADADKKPYVFISYSHADKEKVYDDIRILYQEGVNYWYDKGLEEYAGSPWSLEVKDRLKDDNCIGVIFYLSEDSFLSENFRKEVRITLENNKKYIAVNLSEEKIPLLVLRSALSLRTSNEIVKWIDMEGVEVLAKCFSDEDKMSDVTEDNHNIYLRNSIVNQFGESIFA